MKGVLKYVEAASVVLTAGRELVREFRKPDDKSVDAELGRALTTLTLRCGELEEENKKLRAQVRALGGTPS